jgi:hypothetical protein
MVNDANANIYRLKCSLNFKEIVLSLDTHPPGKCASRTRECQDIAQAYMYSYGII